MLLSIMGSPLAPEHAQPRKVNPVTRRLAAIDDAWRQIGFRTQVGLEEGLRSLVVWWQQERSAKPVGQ